MISWLVLTYLVAAIPFGLVLTTLYGGEVDIRSAGSGNVGATNVVRVYGWRLGLTSLLLDLGKGSLFTLGALLLWPEVGIWWPALVVWVAFTAHCFSVYLEFRGGKGVATAAGGMLVLAPGPTALAAVVWIIVLKATGKSSLGALIAAFALVLLVGVFAPQTVWIVGMLALGITFTHLSNIRRLMAGEENQVLRPVRLGRRNTVDAAELLEQGPAGKLNAPAVWRDHGADPLEPAVDMNLLDEPTT